MFNSSSTLKLTSLHQNLQFKEEVLQLLNDQWPQSRTIRLRRLERSCDEFPTSFIVLDENERLIGYCYVDRLFDDQQSVLIESICIQRALRRKGYGRALLRLVEENLRQRNEKLDFIYLTTTDEREFYLRCGYEETSARVRLNVSSQMFQGNEQFLKMFLAQQSRTNVDSTTSQTVLQKGSTIQRISTVWMKKKIST